MQSIAWGVLDVVLARVVVVAMVDASTETPLWLPLRGGSPASATVRRCSPGRLKTTVKLCLPPSAGVKV